MITRFFASAALTAAILPATVTLAAPPLKPIGLKLLGTSPFKVPSKHNMMCFDVCESTTSCIYELTGTYEGRH